MNTKKYHKIVRKYKKISKRYIKKQIKSYTRSKKRNQKTEQTTKGVLIFFGILFGIILVRLFYLQVIQQQKYDEKITKLHHKNKELKATRGDIYVYDKAKNPIQVTKNITLYNLYLEPQYFAEKRVKGEKKRKKEGEIKNPSAIPLNKDKFIKLITPFVYQHLCVQYGIQPINDETCIRNMESFARVSILPEKKQFFYAGSGTILNLSGDIINEEYEKYDQKKYEEEYQKAKESHTKETIIELIKKTLEEKIKIGPRERNYLGYFTEKDILEDLEKIPYIEVHGYFTYVIPSKIKDKEQAEKELEKILTIYGQKDLLEHASKQLIQKDNKYVELLKNIHPDIAAEIEKIKNDYASIFYQCTPRAIRKYDEKITNFNKLIKNNSSSPNIKNRKETILGIENNIQECKDKNNMFGVTMKVPFFHGLGLTQHDTRYYPYNSFLAHAIGMVNSKGKAIYGVEEYMDKELRGKDGKIIGRASGTIGAIGANEFEVEKPQNGDDIYLTIDQNIQKYIEKILPKYYNRFNADSISVVVMEPKTGYVKAMSNFPTYNPNKTSEAFQYMPLTPDTQKSRDTADKKHFLDVPLYVKEEDGSMRKVKTNERKDPLKPKRIMKNRHGSQVFVDKNIKYPYEPGSVFKPITATIAIDANEINLNDQYLDEGTSDIKDSDGNVIYTIANVSKKCLGQKSYLNALIYSCNVGMINIIQKIGKPVFYSYLEKMNFGKKTNIELGGEQSGKISTAHNGSFAKFITNSYGLGLTATPMQLAQGFSSLLNGGYIMKPTIIDKIHNKNTNETTQNKPIIIRKVFKEETTKKIQKALFQIIENNEITKKYTQIEGFTLGGKSGTAEIVFNNVYQTDAGWTNGSYIGMVTQENIKYMVVVQVRRPRWKKWGSLTAGQIFKDIAGFLIAYDLIQK